MRTLEYPKRIVFELTNACNLRCPMCPRRYIKGDDGFMRADVWLKLINEVAKDSPSSIILPFWRGESLLHPDFFRLIDLALNKSLKIHFSTNGILVTGKYATLLSRCEFVTFSVHNALGFQRAREFLGLKQGKKPTVQISFVRNESTTGNIAAPLIVSKDLGGFDSIRIYEEHSANGVFGKSNHSIGSSQTFCPKLADTLVIAHNGAIARCNHFWKTEQGLSVNARSIKDIWNSAELATIREGYPDAQCALCDQWKGYTCGESFSIKNGTIEHKVFSPSAT